MWSASVEGKEFCGRKKAKGTVTPFDVWGMRRSVLNSAIRVNESYAVFFDRSHPPRNWSAKEMGAPMAPSARFLSCRGCADEGVRAPITASSR
jgi:hypothetical protein